MQEQMITRTQVVLLILGLRLTFSFLIVSTNTPPANQDLWIALLGSILYALFFFAPLFYLHKKFPNSSFIDYPEKTVGKFLGKIFLSFYVGYILFLSVLNTVNIDMFIGSSLMPETPDHFILLIMVIPCIYAAYQGIVNIVWTGQIVIPIVLAIIFITIALGIPLFDIKILLPILKDSTLWQIHTGCYSFALCFHDALLIFFLIPYLKEKKIGKIFLLSLLSSTAFFIMISLAPLLTLGLEFAKHTNYPFFTFAREVKVFDFIERIEALSLTGWIMVELFKLSVYLCFAADMINKIFSTKSAKKFIIPYAALVAVISLSNRLYSIDVINKLVSYTIFPKISLLFIFVIPLFLAMIYAVKKLLH